MTNKSARRKLSNMRLTRRFHFIHMGMWIVITIALVVIVNGLLYALLAQQLRQALEFEPGLSPLYVRITLLLVVETALLCVGILFMGKATSHRIAGPFIALEATCRNIQQGRHELRQKFREYDHLESLEQAFNDMLDSLVEKT